MKEISFIDTPKIFFNKLAYNILYKKSFKKLDIAKSFSDILINRSKESNFKKIFHLIRKSKNQEDFANNIKNYLKSEERSIYASTLLIGNVTGKYVFNVFYFLPLNGLNIDTFSKENKELLQELKSHFVEYIVNNNKRKNTFSQTIKVGEKSIKELSQDINETKLVEDFESVLNGNKINEEKEL